LRVGLGLLLLADLFVRADDLLAHYTNQGVLPWEAVRTSVLSVHMLLGSWWFEAALFVAAAVFAAALVVGPVLDLMRVSRGSPRQHSSSRSVSSTGSPPCAIRTPSGARRAPLSTTP
jgi:hypothetical protein